MDKFTTKELTIEIIEEIGAHKVFMVKVNGSGQIMGENMLRFLKEYTKEEN